MLFSSLLFVFFFLPLVLVVYACSPGRMKNAVLLAASLVFYAWGEPVYIVILLISTACDYGFGLLLGNPKRGRLSKKWIVAGSVCINLGLLMFFKYADFLIHSVNRIAGSQIPLTELPLPIGISFYTFQSISYILDIYRGKAEAQRNWIDFAAYIAMFPQLVAGPIVRYDTVAAQLRERSVSASIFASGVRRFMIGLAKKVLLANNIGMLWESVRATPMETLPMLAAWLGIIAFALQIYFDFSGYSDMAIGLGMMFGFRFPENFDKPYTATSMTDFWRRWHISLGSWFREYVYIPLGGNRKGWGIQIRNLLIVWILTGLWHGASWNFVLWGFYFGALIILEKWFLLRWLGRTPSWLRHSYALLFILFGWVLFVFEQLSDAGRYWLAMLGLNGAGLADSHAWYLLYTNAVLLVILVAACLPQRFRMTERHPVLSLAWLMLLFGLSTAYLVDASFNPFLYFRF